MRTLICFRTSGGLGRHPLEEGDDPLPLLERLARLVPTPAEWWCEPEVPRGTLIVEGDS